MKPRSERIPAAIAKAERLLGSKSDYARVYKTGETFVLTAGEVAAVDALWAKRDALMSLSGYDVADSPALIAFCEKMEGLDHD